MNANDVISRLRDALLGSAQRGAFVQLVLSDVTATADEPACEKIAIRPAPGKAEGTLQVNWFTAERHTTKNLPAAEATGVLSRTFRRAHLQTTAGDLHIRITKKGKVLASEGRPSAPAPPADREHDRTKQYILPADRPSPLLQALDIQTHAGQVRASRRGKFHQINRFLEILASLPLPEPGAVRVIDCGCGAAYLTFAAHHYLRDIRTLDPHTVGIDARGDLVARCNGLRDRLGYANLAFVASRIADFDPPAVPDIVLSLHACDTATDEAIALGIRWRARAILAAPCCQHELRDQLANDSMRAILRHGLLKGRLADVVTDAARAALLRLNGYQCDVLEFVSPEHTTKNLLLRAERRSSKPLPGAEDDYAALKAAWHIAPVLERLTSDAGD